MTNDIRNGVRQTKKQGIPVRTAIGHFRPKASRVD